MTILVEFVKQLPPDLKKEVRDFDGLIALALAASPVVLLINLASSQLSDPVWWSGFDIP